MIEKNIRRRRESTMIYYTADLHFHYALLLPSRPFATVEEMDEALVKNWNDTVGPEDTVYLVGDIGWNGGRVPGELLERLSGHKHLIRGNHDTGYEDAGQLPRVLNAGVDVNRYRPVTLAELVENNRAFYAGERDDEVPPPPPMERGLPGSLPGKPDFRPIPRRKEDV